MTLCSECRGPGDGPQIRSITAFKGDFQDPRCDVCNRRIDIDGNPIEERPPLLLRALSGLRAALVEVFR
jgi:hypothetical protein